MKKAFVELQIIPVNSSVTYLLIHSAFVHILAIVFQAQRKIILQSLKIPRSAYWCFFLNLLLY